MSGVNKAIIVGNLGRDPELRYTQGGTPVTQLSVATKRVYKDKQDAKHEETEWHRVVVWGKQAEHCNTYLAKGRQVYVEGRIQTRNYEDKDGIKRYSTEIIAETVQFLGSKGGGGTSNRSEPKAGSKPAGSGDQPTVAGCNDNYIPSDPGDDDIPF